MKRYGWEIEKGHIRGLKEMYKQYYGGFAYRKQQGDKMFKKEIDDLRQIYKGGLATIDKDIEITLPDLLDFMERFVSLYKEKEEMECRLDDLDRKVAFSEDGDE